MLSGYSCGAEGNNRQRRLWAKARAAFGSGLESEALIRLERLNGRPGVMLSAAIHYFLGLADDARSRVICSYLSSLAQPKLELLPLEEAAKFADGFQEALQKIYGGEQGIADQQ
jgi:hypothetical protein